MTGVEVTTEHLVAAIGRPLRVDEASKATRLIGRAQRLLMRRWPDIPKRVASGELDEEDVRDIVLGLVLPLLLGPGLPGVASWSRTQGPYHQALTFAEASTTDGWTMVLLPDMIEILDPGRPSEAKVGWLW